MRVGIGFDGHRFDPERQLILGGVLISQTDGLQGHSDADVLVHAVIDALLGSVAAGDIGSHFPDTDEKYRGISSMALLGNISKLITQLGYIVINVDVTVLLQEPKLAPYRDRMRANIAGALGLDIDQVSIKATTAEGLGFTGRKEGAAAQAVVLVEERGKG